VLGGVLLDVDSDISEVGSISSDTMSTS